MTLGEYIARLRAADPEKVLPIGLTCPHSWRGAYDELAFEPARDITVGEMLKQAELALDREFTGYKGGEYWMTSGTPINIDHYGVWSNGHQAWSILLDLMLGQSEPTEGKKAAQALAAEICGRITKPMTLAEICREIQGGEYSAELMMQHLLLIAAGKSEN